MSRYADQVRDEYGRFVPGVSVYVYKWDAIAQVAGDLEALTDDLSVALANPLISDADGLYYFNSADGQKLLEFHYGGKVQERDLILVGALPVPQATFGGLFINASALTIPVGMDLICTTGYSSLDVGAAVYTYDAAVNSAYVIAHPRTSFISLNGRGFRLSTEQDITPQMYGAVGDGVADDTVAIQAALDSGIKSLLVPAGDFVASTLLMPHVFNFVLRGVGPSSRLIAKAGASTALIRWATASNVYDEHTIRNIGLVGTNGSQHLIDTTGAGGLTIDSLYVTDVPVGKSAVYINGVTTATHDVRLRDIQVYSNTAGHSALRFGPLAADSSVNDFIFNGNLLTSYGIYGDIGAVTIAVGNSHPYNAAANIIKLAGSNDWWMFTGVVFDNATNNLVEIADSAHIGFANTYFEAVKPSQSAVNIAGASSGICFTNSRFNASSTAVSCVITSAGTTDAQVIGGSISGAFSAPFNFGGARSWASAVAGYTPLGLRWSKTGVQAAAQAQSTTRYLGEGDNATEANAVYTAPYDSTLVAIFIAVAVTPAAGQTFTYQARKNGVNIGSALVISNTQLSGTLTLNQAFSQHDQLTISSVYSATSGASTSRWSAEFMA